MISDNQKEKIVRTGGSGGVDVSQTKKAPAVTTMHANTQTHAVMWTGFGDKIKNACGQAVSGIRKSKTPAANMPIRASATIRKSVHAIGWTRSPNRKAPAAMTMCVRHTL